MRTTIIVIFATICSFAHAGKLTLDDICNLTECSEDREIIVRVNKDGYFKGVWPKRPYFYQNLGSVLMGEALSFEAAADKEGNVTLIYVPEKSNKSININLTQPGDKPEEVMSIAHIENNSEFNIIYSGGVFHTESNRLMSTSVCGIQAGLSSFESWPYAISAFLFKDIKAVSKEEVSSHGCK